MAVRGRAKSEGRNTCRQKRGGGPTRLKTGEPPAPLDVPPPAVPDATLRLGTSAAPPDHLLPRPTRGRHRRLVLEALEHPYPGQLVHDHPVRGDPDRDESDIGSDFQRRLLST